MDSTTLDSSVQQHGRKPDAVEWLNRGGSIAYDEQATIYTNRNGSSVSYNKSDYPDFTPYLYKEANRQSDVRIALSGNRARDEAAANKAGGFEETPIGYTWHHHEDVGRMQLVDQRIHKEFSHTGGFSLNKERMHEQAVGIQKDDLYPQNQNLREAASGGKSNTSKNDESRSLREQAAYSSHKDEHSDRPEPQGLIDAAAAPASTSKSNDERGHTR